MPISQGIATSFKVEMLNGLHAFGTSVVRAGTGADTFKIALYTSAANIGPSSTVYTATGEVTGVGYTAGGNTLTIAQVPVASGTTALLDFADSTWAGSTITARGAMIYNSTQGNRTVAVLDFGIDKSTTGGNFTVVFPLADVSNAIIRVA